MEKVGIVILNYNNAEDTIACVDSVVGNIYSNFKIYIVDNCSTDGGYEILKTKESDRIKVLQTGVNLGYAGGNNIGLKEAIQDGCKYLCILNNDTLVEKTFIVNCVENLQEEKIGIISPAVLDYQTDIVQSTGGKLNLSKGYSKLINNGKKYSELYDNVECEIISGACMFFKKELIEEIGLLPENYFLFYEETEWCLKAKKAGYINKSIIDFKIQHKGSATINSVSGLSEYLLRRNRVVFVKRNASSIQYFKFLMYILIEPIYLMLREKRNYFRFYKFYLDGILNRVNLKKYPFIKINNNG